MKELFGCAAAVIVRVVVMGGLVGLFLWAARTVAGF